jgi:hypothetical protein
MKKQSRKYFLPQRSRRVTVKRKFFFLEKQEEVKKLFYSTFNKSVGQCAVFSFALFFTQTDKKENKIFFIYKEIQKGAVAKSYITNGLLIQYMTKNLRIFSYLRKPFFIYYFATAPSEFPYFCAKFSFLFLSVQN